MTYFPDKNQDILKYTNLHNDTLIFTVINTSSSGPSSYGWNCKCSCGSQAYFDTEPNNKDSLRINGGINIFESDLAYIGCSFYDGDSIQDQFTLDVRGNNPYSNDNSSFFGDSIIIDEEENTRISKVIIVEGKGIVEFFDKKENCNWIRIE